jgi:uncharacterized protein (TIGR03435 family)
MRSLLLLSAAFAGAGALASAQGAFEVVSIKANHTALAASDTNTTPGRLSLVNVTPLSLIRRAFGVQDFQIVGAPDWVATTRFDVIATVRGNAVLNDQQRQPLLRQMLAERWNFRFHRETSERGVYSLVVADSSKLVVHTGPGEYAMKVEPADRVIVRSTRGNIGRLVEILSRYSDRIVLDDTGLTGEYDFTLEWVQNPGVEGGSPTLFTALREQLGLRLEPVRRAIPLIVIDSIDHPTEN